MERHVDPITSVVLSISIESFTISGLRNKFIQAI